jgi:hypothetical protein
MITREEYADLIFFAASRFLMYTEDYCGLCTWGLIVERELLPGDRDKIGEYCKANNTTFSKDIRAVYRAFTRSNVDPFSELAGDHPGYSAVRRRPEFAYFPTYSEFRISLLPTEPAF